MDDTVNGPIINGYGGIAFETNGTNERLRIASTGNVGINQTSPQRILHIGTSGTAEANIRLQGGSDYGEIRVKDSDNALTFHYNVGGAGSRELFSSNGSTGHFSINCYSYQALTITTNENGTNGPEVQLMHNTASPAAGDIVGQLRYSGKDSAGNTELYSKIETKATTVTSGSETGHVDFSTRGGGAYNSMFRLSARGTASAPSYTTDDMNGIILDTYNTGNPYPRYFNFIAKSAGNTDSNIGFWTESVGGSPTEKLRISADGYVTKPNLPTFCARWQTGDAQDLNSGDILIFTHVASSTTRWNNGGHYSTSTGKFTAPVAGFYYFAGRVMSLGWNNGDDIQDLISIQSSSGIITYPTQRRSRFRSDADANGYYTSSISAQVQAAAGATFWLQSNRNGNAVSYTHLTLPTKRIV